MRAVVQRTKSASVTVNGETIAQTGGGLTVFIGIQESDTEAEIHWLAEKLLHLRLFEDEHGKMNLSVAQTGGELLIVSQFTLYGDCRKGRRPGYSAAAKPQTAEPIYNRFIEYLKDQGVKVASGQFRASMQVELINDGPVTLLLDSDKTF